MLASKKAIFPPKAAVREGAIVERPDPRGGLIEYVVSRYEFSGQLLARAARSLRQSRADLILANVAHPRLSKRRSA